MANPWHDPFKNNSQLTHPSGSIHVMNSEPSMEEHYLDKLDKLDNDIFLNWTLQHEPESFDILKHPACRSIILALYILVITIGILGNGTVIYIVIQNKRLQNITNIFIANLALSDIGLCAFCLPLQLHYQLTDNWIFGEVMCRLTFAFFAVPMYVSTLMILLIAFDRYWCIVYPLKQRITKIQAFILILLSVVISIVLSVPVIMHTIIKKVREPKANLYKKLCWEEWPSSTARMIYTILTFLFQFILPLIITAIFYFRIYTRLQRRPSQRAVQNEHKIRTNKILLSIVILFVFCWLPWNLFSLMTEIERNLVDGPYFKFVDLVLKLIAMGSSCVNPFLYCWLNENFRKELDNMAMKMNIVRDGLLNQTVNKQTVPVSNLNPPDESGFTRTDSCSILQGEPSTTMPGIVDICHHDDHDDIKMTIFTPSVCCTQI